jgi:hypothetical protein
VRLLVTGSGSLAAATLEAMSVRPGPFDSFAVASRHIDRADALGRVVAARVASSGRSTEVLSLVIDWDDPTSLAATLTAARPCVVLHTASWQSPWALGGDDAWSALVRRVGYGATLPLQAVLAARIGRVIREALPDARFVNACYPDLVNRELLADGIPVECGIGNVAILAEIATSERRFAPRLRMVAHHSHVAAAVGGTGAPVPVLAWSDRRPIDMSSWLGSLRLPADQRLNVITGASAVPLLHALADPAIRHAGHAPGPAGLCGGYPIAVARRTVSVDLPDGVRLDDAVVNNRRAAAGDGLAIDDDGRVDWTPRARLAISETPVEVREALSGLFSIAGTEERALRLRDLRGWLARS